MDKKRSLLLIGSRTGKNVLKGKTIRKHDDGADEFIDYWTASDTDDTSSSKIDEYSDISQTQKESSISKTRLSTLRSSCNSKVLPYVTKIKDHTKLQKSPLKHVQNNILKDDKDISASLTKIQKLHSKLQQGGCQNSTGILSNSIDKSHVESSESSSNFQSPVNNNRKSTSITTANIQISKNINIEDGELNTTKPYDCISYVKKSGSPLSSKSIGKDKKAPVSPSRCLRSRNLSHHISELATSDTNDIGRSTENTFSSLSKESDKREKTAVIHENVSNANVSASDVHILSLMKVKNTEANSTNAKSEIHPLADKTLNVINNTVVNREASKILKTSFGNHTVKKMKNSLQMAKTIAKYDKYDAEIMRMAQETEMLEKEHSSNYSLHIQKPTRGKKAKSIALKGTAKSDEETNEIAPKETDTNVYQAQNSYNSVSSNKLHTRRRQKSSVLSGRIDTELLQNKLVSGEKSSNNQIDEVEAANVSDIDNNTQLSLINESGDKAASSSNDLKKRYIDKSTKVLRTSKYFSMDNSKNSSKDNTESATDIPAKENEIMQNLNIKRKKHASKIHENLVASKTFCKGNTDSSATEKEIAQNLVNKREKCIKSHENLEALETFSNERDENAFDSPEQEKDISQNLSIKRKKRASKIHKNLKSPKTFSEGNTANSVKEREIAQNLVNEREKCIKSHENLVASETFSNERDENAFDIPEHENDISQNLSIKRKKKRINKRKKRANKIHENLKSPKTFSKGNTANSVKEREIAQTLVNERGINKTFETLKASETFSKSIGNIVEIPEVENRITPILHGKNKRNEFQTKKKLKDSETFSKHNQCAMEIPAAETGTNCADNKRKSVSEDSDSISSKDNSDQHVLSPMKKRKKEKKITTKQDAFSLRRSSRQKFPPLAEWRNERILYKNENGTYCAFGVDKGTREDDAAIRQFVMNNERTKKVRKFKKHKKIKVYDAINKRNCKLSLIKSFAAVSWDEGFAKEECPYRIKKIFQTHNSSFGYLQIKINEEKPMQYMPGEDICLIVLKGKVEVTIHEEVHEVEEKDMWIIPRSVPYKIKNIGPVAALLAFCVGNFQYIESQI